MVAKKTAAKKASKTSVAVKKTHTELLKSKRITRSKAEPKARPAVQFSTQVLDLPMIPRSHHEALNFIHRNVMPPFGKLSKNVDIKNTMFKNALGEHFGKHPDPDGEGTYVFQRRGDEVLVYQIVPGRADSAFVLKVDTVRRGPKTIEYFAGVREADPKERKQAIHVGLGVDAKLVEATPAAEPGAAASENLTIPNVFHKPWPEVYTILKANHIKTFDVDNKLMEAVKTIAQHTAAWSRSTDDLVREMDCVVQTQVGITTTDSAAQGSVDVQLFIGARAGAIPVGVVHLTTKRNAGGYDEIVEVMPELTVSTPLGGGHPQRWGAASGPRRWGAPSGVLDNSSRQQPLREMPPMVGIGEPRAAWGADMTEPFGRPDQGGLSPYGKAPGLYGQRPSPSYPGGYPEKTIFTTNSLSRFSAYIGMMTEDELPPMARGSADQVLLQLNTSFRNTGAGVMSFVAEYVPGKALVFQVRNGYGEVIFAQPIFLS
jgi:hypothetical protein